MMMYEFCVIVFDPCSTKISWRLFTFEMMKKAA